MEPFDRAATLSACLWKLAETSGDDPALVVSADLVRSEILHWRQLAEIVVELGQLLRERCLVGHGESSDKCGLAHGVRNDVRDLLTALACSMTGILEFPIDVFGGDAYVEACRSAARNGSQEDVSISWLCDDEKAELVERAIRRATENDGNIVTPAWLPDADAEAIVLWTSGTSGNPKGAVLTHRSLYTNAKAKLVALPQSPLDRRLTVLSIAHAYARTCDIGTWLLSGCCLAIGRGFKAWCGQAQSFHPTLCNCVPSLSRRILDSRFDSPALFAVGCGGAAMPERDFADWKDRGVHVIQGYGLTESGPVIASQSPGESIAAHVGRPVPGWECDWVGERLRVRGEHLFKRYWNDPSDSNLDQDGWLDTGDLVRVNPEHGQWQILGRADDRIILSNGHNVDPSGLEQRVMALPGIAFCFIAAANDNRRIEMFLQWSDSADRNHLAFEHWTASLPDWEKPRLIHCVEISPDIRTELFNRKGGVRRAAMKRFIASE